MGKETSKLKQGHVEYKSIFDERVKQKLEFWNIIWWSRHLNISQIPQLILRATGGNLAHNIPAMENSSRNYNQIENYRISLKLYNVLGFKNNIFQNYGWVLLGSKC